jgi:hypothetical protein
VAAPRTRPRDHPVDARQRQRYLTRASRPIAASSVPLADAPRSPL